MNYKNYKVRAFLEDILPDTQNDKHIAHVGNVPQIRVAILTAWQVVNTAISHPTYGSNDTKYRRDFEALKAVDKLLTAQNSIILSPRKTNIQNMLTFATSNEKFTYTNSNGNVQSYQAVGVPCNTCTGKDITFEALHIILDDVDKLQMYKHLKSSNNGGPKVPFNGQSLNQNGIFSAVASLYNSNWNYYDFMGFAFITRIVAKTSQPSVVTGFEVNYRGVSGTNRRGDVSCNFGGRDVMVDGKSWTQSTLQSSFKVGQSSYTQFLDYIRFITNLNQLEYWFDERKMNKATINTTLQGIWYKNNTLTPEGNALFEAIWGNNTGLRGSVFPINNTGALKPLALNEFKQMVSTLDNKLFGFIKVK